MNQASRKGWPYYIRPAHAAARRPAARTGPIGVNLRPCERQAGQPQGLALLYTFPSPVRPNKRIVYSRASPCGWPAGGSCPRRARTSASYIVGPALAAGLGAVGGRRRPVAGLGAVGGRRRPVTGLRVVGGRRRPVTGLRVVGGRRRLPGLPGGLFATYSTFLMASTTLEPPVARPPSRTAEPVVGRAWSRTRFSP